MMAGKKGSSKFESLISTPFGQAPDNSYYGDPRHVKKEQHGLEDIERDKSDDSGCEDVVILGYN